MKRATVISPVKFVGDSPDPKFKRLAGSLIGLGWLKKPTSMIIDQPENPGLYWKIGENGTEYPIDIHHLYGFKTPIIGARQIVLSDQKDHELTNIFPENGQKAFVLEHILSALNYVGITDATIQLEPSQFDNSRAFAPIVGPGIKTLVEHLDYHKLESTEDAPFLEVTKDVTYMSNPDEKKFAFSASPHDTLKLNIKKSDLGKIAVQSTPIELQNAYEELDLNARPVARLHNPIQCAGMQFINWLGYKGVSPDTYIIGTYKSTEEDITNKMLKGFQSGKNEQLWHGAIDRFGELFAISGRPIKGNFSYESINHLSAIDSYKKLFRDGGFNISNSQ